MLPQRPGPASFALVSLLALLSLACAPPRSLAGRTAGGGRPPAGAQPAPGTPAARVTTGSSGPQAALTPSAPAHPMVGVLGAQASDLAAISALGPVTVQIPLPPDRATFDADLAQAKQLGLNLMVSIDQRQAIQTPELSLDTARLTSLLKPILAGVVGQVDTHFAGVLIVDDPCHMDQRGRKWTLSSGELAAGYNAVKAIDPNIQVIVNFSKSTCMDTFVKGARPGTHMADVGILKAFYYKWSTTPNLFDSYGVTARAAKAYDPSMRVIPKLGLYETVGREASALPTTDWLRERESEFAKSGAFDGVLFYNYRPAERIEIRTISDVITDPSYVSAMRDVFKAAGG